MQQNDIYELIECMTTLIRSEERKKCTELGLQPVHFQVLHYLSRCNKYSNTPAAVANYLGMTRGTVSQSLIILDKKGYIGKTPDAADKRVVIKVAPRRHKNPPTGAARRFISHGNRYIAKQRCTAFRRQCFSASANRPAKSQSIAIVRRL